jgi:hypothetical protein
MKDIKPADDASVPILLEPEPLTPWTISQLCSLWDPDARQRREAELQSKLAT